LDEIKTLMDKSFEALSSAQSCIIFKEYTLSVNRSYYACFYAAKALLLKKGIITKKHEGTIARFGEEYVLGGNFDRNKAKFLHDLEKHRNNVDYIFTLEFGEFEALEDLEKAKNFVSECEKYFK